MSATWGNSENIYSLGALPPVTPSRHSIRTAAERRTHRPPTENASLPALHIVLELNPFTRRRCWPVERWDTAASIRARNPLPRRAARRKVSVYRARRREIRLNVHWTERPLRTYRDALTGC